MSAVPHVRLSLRGKIIPFILISAPSARQVVLVVMTGVLGFGDLRVLQAQPAQAHAVEQSRPLRDRFGDPLPEGAIRRFGTLRFRHHGLGDIAFTPDGKKLIAGGGFSPLIVFDAATGRRLRELGRNNRQARNLMGFAVSPDGKWVAGCGSDVFVWDLETGRLIRQFYYDNRYQEVVFSPDGTKIAAIKEVRRHDEYQLRLVIGETATGKHAEDWHLKEGKPLSFGFHGLAFSPDGKFLAGQFSDLREEKPFVYSAVSSHVWLLDAATGKRVRTFGLAGVPIVCFAFQPGSRRLATYGKDGLIRFWDVTTGEEVQRFQAAKGREENGFGVLRFSADGRRCAVLTDRAKFLTVLDAMDSRVIRRIEGKESSWRVVLAFSGDGGTVASARYYDESCVRVWDVASGVERLADAGHRAAVTTLSLSADGRTLTSQDRQGQRIHWDLQTGKGEIRPAIKQEEIGHLIWSPDFSQKTLLGPRWRVVYKHQRPALMEVWSLDGSRLIRKWEAHTQWVPEVALSPDGTQLAIAVSNFKNGHSFTVMLWDPEREEKPRQMEERRGYCRQLLFSHDGKRLLGRADGGFSQSPGNVWIWDAATARVVSKRTTTAVPGQLVLTADDRVLLIGGIGNDATIHVWDMATAEEFARMTDPARKQPSESSDSQSQPAITDLVLSADERFLAVVSSWSDVSAVRVWETGSWKLVRAFVPVPPRHMELGMVFARDGRSLFVANSDSTILEWDVSGRAANGRQQPDGKNFKEDRLNILWQALAETPDKAYPAVWEMLDHPAESVRFLIDKVPPLEPVKEKRLRQLLAQLDSDSFVEREEASRQLLILGEQFLPLLRQALNDRPSLEMKKRLEGILEGLKRGPSTEQLRLLRALAVLEWSDQPEADQHLRRLATGVPSASLTQAANAALRRMGR